MSTNKIDVSLSGQLDRISRNSSPNGKRYSCHYLALDINTGQPFRDNYKASLPLEENNMLIAVSESCLTTMSPDSLRRTAIEMMTKWLIKVSNRLPPHEQLLRGFEEANYHIWRSANESDQPQILSASMAVALVEKNIAYIVQIGNAGAHLLRNGRIRRLSDIQTSPTTDQSSRGSLAAAAQLELGRDKLIQPSIITVELQAGDILLLSTGGIYGCLRVADILQTVMRNIAIATACQQLILTARQVCLDKDIAVAMTLFSGPGLSPKTNTITSSLSYIAPQELTATAKGETKDLSSVPIIIEGTEDTPVANTDEREFHRQTIGLVLDKNIIAPTVYGRQEMIEDGFINCGAQLVQTEVLLQNQRKEIKAMLDWAQSQNIINTKLLGSYMKLEITLKKLAEARAIFEETERDFPFSSE